MKGWKAYGSTKNSNLDCMRQLNCASFTCSKLHLLQMENMNKSLQNIIAALCMLWKVAQGRGDILPVLGYNFLSDKVVNSEASYRKPGYHNLPHHEIRQNMKMDHDESS